MPRILLIHERDNVVVALEPVRQGEKVCCGAGERQLTARSDIPFGHKMSLAEIPKGAEIRKYGEVIGRATRDIRSGEHVHVSNIESLRGRGDLR